jgi:Major Facilitator Superfamily
LNPPHARRVGLFSIYSIKGIRVFVSGLLSITIPFYLGTLGYGYFFQGVALVAIVAGNALSNILVTYLDGLFGRRRLLQGFSLLMVAAGGILAYSVSAVPIIVACLIGNISSSGTEAGPFQSVEAGVLPDLAGGSAVKAFGWYNLVGYSAAALGQLASAGPALFGESRVAFQGIFVAFSLVGMVLFATYSRIGGLDAARSAKAGLGNLGPQAREDITRLSGLFAVDAFGGVFASTYLLSIWFHATFGLELEVLGPVFFAASLIAASSTYGAAIIAQRMGNLRTMVYTHLVSNAFLVMMALAGSLLPALAFLFLRQSLSQMDVPTRQALMAEMFRSEDRVQAYAVTNTVRSGGTLAGGPVAAAILGVGFLSGVLFASAGSKIVYDLATFIAYRKRYR